MWPALMARRVEPVTPQGQSMRDNGEHPAHDLPMGERYPKLGNLTFKTSGVQPTSNYAQQDFKESAVEVANHVDATKVEDPFADTHETSGGVQRNASDSPHLSASAAALEKSTSQNFTEVRQTRTSSLRARLSAGEVVKNRNSKIMGFTDFTTNTPDSQRGVMYRSSLSLRKASKASTTSESNLLNGVSEPAHHTLRPYASVESLGRAPAKFVGGSRRVPPRRPSSRGSLYENSRPSTATTRPGSRDTGSSSIKDNRPSSKSGKDGRRSSIPVPKATAASQQPASAMDNNVNGIYAVDASFNEPRVSEQSSINPFEDSPQPMEATSVTITSEKATVTNAKSKKGALEAIVESPRHAYTFRRLSVKSPKYGPTLTISPSATKYIMGDSDKENRPSSRGKSKAKPLSSSGKQNERPQSSRRQSNPRISLLGPKGHEPKVEPTEVEEMAHNDVRGRDLRPISAQLSMGSRVQSVNDSFFDAPEHMKSEGDGGLRDTTNAREEAWISPMREKPYSNEDEATSVKDFAKVTRVAPPQGEEYDPFNYEITPVQRNRENDKLQTPALPLPKSRNTLGLETPAVAVEPCVVTPEHGKPESISPSSFPPRGSSRLDKTSPDTSKTLSVPAVIRDKAPSSSPFRETGPPTPPKDFVNRQNKLGSALGHASSQLDLMDEFKANGSTVTNRKRDSTAAASFRSNRSLVSSTSKSRFNFRGLFHKSSTEDTSAKKSKSSTLRTTHDHDFKPKSTDHNGKARLSRPTVQTNGSPFPSISEVHPIHRPIARPSPRSSAIITPTLSTLPTTATNNGSTISTRPTTPRTKRSPPPSSISNPTYTTDSLTNDFSAPSARYGSSPLADLSQSAISLLSSARQESSPSKKDKLLQIGKVLVDVITQARDAERAVEEARMALSKAEMARDACLEAVKRVGGMELRVG